jgi:hypothetical protein
LQFFSGFFGGAQLLFQKGLDHVTKVAGRRLGAAAGNFLIEAELVPERESLFCAARFPCSLMT